MVHDHGPINFLSQRNKSIIRTSDSLVNSKYESLGFSEEKYDDWQNSNISDEGGSI